MVDLGQPKISKTERFSLSACHFFRENNVKIWTQQTWFSSSLALIKHALNMALVYKIFQTNTEEKNCLTLNDFQENCSWPKGLSVQHAPFWQSLDALSCRGKLVSPLKSKTQELAGLRASRTACHLSYNLNWRSVELHHGYLQPPWHLTLVPCELLICATTTTVLADLVVPQVQSSSQK